MNIYSVYEHNQFFFIFLAVNDIYKLQFYSCNCGRSTGQSVIRQFLITEMDFDPYEVRVGFMVDIVVPRFAPEPCGFPLANVIPQNHHIYSAFFFRDIGNGASTGHSSTET
jgi:hypothetical protein